MQEVKSLLLQHVDPVANRKVMRAAGAAASDDTFKVVAGLWLSKKKKEWSEVHYTKSQRALERDIFPVLGALPIASITPPMVAMAVERISNRGAAETASRILQHVGAFSGLPRPRACAKPTLPLPPPKYYPKSGNADRCRR